MEQQHSILNNAKETLVGAESDNALVTKAKAGDIAAFELIMRRHNQRLYRLARSILQEQDEAMDVVQESYIKAYYQLHQFKGPDGFASWLSRIVNNEALMRLRKSQRIFYILDEPGYESDNMKSNDLQPMDFIAAQQHKKLLEDAIDSLPMKYRCVYMMRAIQELSTQETARSLDVSENVVKTRFLRAKRTLRNQFEGYLEQTGLTAHEFAGHLCDSVVLKVLIKLHKKQF